MTFGELKKRIESALADRPRCAVEQEGLIPAAVLLMLTRHPDPHILFVKRSEEVAHHKGQISFPGGVVSAQDGSRLATALRECQEEIGLSPELVEIFGALDDTETQATQFVITPFVGAVTAPVEWRPDGREIRQVLEVPLARLLDPACFRVELRERGGQRHPVYFFAYENEVIWGATARILKQFFDLVLPEAVW